MRRLWVVAITEGTELRFPPEVYPTLSRATHEAYHWRWFLSRADEAKSTEVTEGHWRVGRVHVHLAPATLPSSPPGLELWVGFQTRGPASQPRFALFASRGEARTWVLSGSRLMKRASREQPLCTTAQYGSDKTELWVGCHRAKTSPWQDGSLLEGPSNLEETTEYAFVVTATYTHVVNSTIRALPGLSHEELADVVERDFPHLASYRGSATELDWTLTEMTERPQPPEASTDLR
jgi:hypothetical protein